VRDEVPGDGVEAIGGGDDVVVALQFPFQPLCCVDAVDFQFIQLVGNPLVQVADGHAQVLASGVVIERHGSLILHCSLKIVG